jgi:predicted phosphodiesterase
MVMSDLHNEFDRGAGPSRPTAAWFDLRKIRSSIQGHPDVGPLLDQLRGEGIDLVVMAGDIDLDCHGITYADRVSLFIGAQVVYVMGNHEAYQGRDLDLLLPELHHAAAATCGRVTFLENEAAVFDFRGERLHVLGCTLWTDYAIYAGGDRDQAVTAAMRDAGRGLNDHRLISLGGIRFSPEMARQLHNVSRQWLGREVARIRAAEGDEAKVLIVTHHAPVAEASPPQYRGGSLTPAFASDLTAEIAEWQPTAWIWGHTHHSMSTQIGKTRLLSSQRGYVCVEAGTEDYVPLVTEI